MKSIYFKCDWILTPVDSQRLVSIIEMSNELVCVVWINWHDIHAKRKEKGYFIANLIIFAPSEEIYVIWQSLMKNYIKIEGCHRSENIDTGNLFRLKLSRELIDLEQDISQLAIYNQAILEKKTLWVNGIWPIAHLSIGEVMHLLRLSDKWQGQIYYGNPFQPGPGRGSPNAFWFIKFILNTRSPNTFDEYMDEFLHTIRLYHWKWLSDETQVAQDLADTVLLTTERIVKFQSLIDGVL